MTLYTDLSTRCFRFETARRSEILSPMDIWPPCGVPGDTGRKGEQTLRNLCRCPWPRGKVNLLHARASTRNPWKVGSCCCRDSFACQINSERALDSQETQSGIYSMRPGIQGSRVRSCSLPSPRLERFRTRCPGSAVPVPSGSIHDIVPHPPPVLTPLLWRMKDCDCWCSDQLFLQNC
jgi:hypothetical protein